MELSDVRSNIDRVDGEIRKLFIERMQLADQVACIKAKTGDAINKPEREKEIIKRQTEGIDDKILKEYTALIRKIMLVSREYQYAKTLNLRDAFPFEYETEKSGFSKLAVIKSQHHLCEGFQDEAILTADSYDEIGQLITANQVDAGMGFIEETGLGVPDELHDLLLKYHLYINKCEIREKDGIRKKCVIFSKKLIVLPKHNKIKIMFQCVNKSGSLSNILSIISDYDFNLTEIHSKAFRKDGHLDYCFFIELNANMAKHETKALLFQLSQETSYLDILGSYFFED